MGATFTGSTAEVCGGLVFTALLGWACVSDLRTRRIPNRLVLVLAVGGLLFAPYLHADGLQRASLGLLLGLVLWFPFYVLRVLGAGDVKLFAAAASWLGPRGALDAAVLAAIVGGVLAVLMAARAGVLGNALRSLPGRLVQRPAQPVARVPALEARSQVPYGIALAAGALLAGWLPHFVW